MKRKINELSMVLYVVFTLMGISQAKADTLIFPVIATNTPYVTTIASVADQGPASTHLKYIYRYKATFVGGLPNYDGDCSTFSFVRPTFSPDLVSFDASGSLGGGNALFNDPDNYGGAFYLGVAGPQRAYLLVTNSDAAGNRVDVGANQSLKGEAIVMDIFAGAAWGYRAVNDVTREDFTFTPANLMNVLDPGMSPRFTFFPLNEWTTKFFVTPVGTNIESANLTSTIHLYTASPAVRGINGRGRNTYSFNVPLLVKCTAAVNLTDLLDSTAKAALDTTGGWGRFVIESGSSAYVYKLEYVVNNPTYGGTNNNGYLLTPFD